MERSILYDFHLAFVYWFQAPLDKTVQKEPSRTRKRKKRQTEAGTQVDSEKRKKRMRRAKKKAKEQATDAPAIHGAKNEKDLYLAVRRFNGKLNGKLKQASRIMVG